MTPFAEALLAQPITLLDTFHLPSETENDALFSLRMFLIRYFPNPYYIAADYRDPNVNSEAWTAPSIWADATTWHRDDAHLAVKEYSHILFWSNKHGTEVKLPDGMIIQIPDGQIAIVNNSTCWHRLNTNCEPVRDRHFIRMCLKEDLLKTAVDYRENKA